MGKEIITTKSVGYQFVDIPQEFVLDETARTKTVFKAEMHAGGVRGHVMRYRKNANGICEKLIPTNFNELHPDDGIKIDLPTNALKILLEKNKRALCIVGKPRNPSWRKRICRCRFICLIDYRC